MALTLEQVREIGIPERYIYVTRKDIGTKASLCESVGQWLEDARLYVLIGQDADKVLAVIAKYIVGTFNQVVRWVDFLEFQNCINEFDEDGRKKIYYFMNIPVLVVSRLDFTSKLPFDLQAFLMTRYNNKRLTLCSSSSQYNIPSMVPHIRIPV